MKTVIETTQLEFDKSDFLIDLVKHDNGKLYIEIIQTILDSNKKPESIKINPTVLLDIIKVLQNYQAKLPQKSELELKHITEIDQQKIQNNYLKGVTIKDLAMQFDQETELNRNDYKKQRNRNCRKHIAQTKILETQNEQKKTKTIKKYERTIEWMAPPLKTECTLAFWR